MKPDNVINKWVHFSLPIGPYYALDPALQKEDGTSDFEWTSVGVPSPSWGSINGLAIAIVNDATYDVYMDDIHFSGQIIREAKDSSEITAVKKQHQKFIRSDCALDDTCKMGTPRTTDTGTAARLCYAELLRRSQTPTVGIIHVPGAPTMLPGQTLHIHAAKRSNSGTCAVCGAPGTFRIAQDMRIKELRHNYTNSGFSTMLNLTSDVTNSNAFGVPTAYSLILEQAYGLTHGEARDLKSGGIDPLLLRLTETY
jgi:hypothetical protein